MPPCCCAACGHWKNASDSAPQRPNAQPQQCTGRHRGGDRQGTGGGDAVAAEAAVLMHRDCGVGGEGGGGGQPKWNWVSPMQES